MARTVEISCFAVPLLEVKGEKKPGVSVFQRVCVETTHSQRQSTNVGIPKG